MKRILRQEAGNVTAMVLVLVAVAAVMVAGSVANDGVSHLTNFQIRQRTDRYYEAETAMNNTAGWLRLHSQDMMNAFLRAGVYSTFDRSGTSVGTNDTAYPFPTQIKVRGTNQSVILTSDSDLGTSNFPATTDQNGGAFNPVTSFADLEIKDAIVKVTLVDAEPKSASGDIPSGPTTDYLPIYRIDSMNAVDRGAHVYGYYIAKLVQQYPLGFFGKNSITAKQGCDSYNSESGSYGPSTQAANCPIGSNGDVCVSNNTNIYGSVKTIGTRNTGGSCGGSVCGDLSCSTPGDSCSGSSCEVDDDWPTYPDYDTSCPPAWDQGAVTVSSATTLSSGGCVASVSVSNNQTLTLTDTHNAYYFRTLDLGGSIDVVPDDPNGTVKIYVLNLSDTTINGNQTLNSSARPSQFQMIYLGNSSIKLNGNADFKMLFIAPNSSVTVQGNADFYGGVVSADLTLTGSGALHYDESIGSSAPKDMSFKLTQVNQRYR